jgi:hypothetical protein
MSWCDNVSDHEGHDACPGLPYPGLGHTLAALPWNTDRPERDQLAAAADGTGPDAAAARRELATVPADAAAALARLIFAREQSRPQSRPALHGHWPGAVWPTTDQPEPYSGPQSVGTADSFMVPGDARLIAVLGPDDDSISLMTKADIDTLDAVGILRQMADRLEARHREWLDTGSAEADRARVVDFARGLTQVTAEDGRRYLVASDGTRYGPFPPVSPG